MPETATVQSNRMPASYETYLSHHGITGELVYYRQTAPERFYGDADRAEKLCKSCHGVMFEVEGEPGRNLPGYLKCCQCGEVG